MKRLKPLLHFAAAFCILYLGDSFRNEFPDFLFRDRNDLRLIEWSCYLLSVCVAMQLYCHYISRIKAETIGIDRIRGGVKWLLLSLALAVLVVAFYLLFVPGTLYIYADSARGVLRGVYYWLFSSTVFEAIAEGLLYRGMVFSAMKRDWGETKAILGLSVVLTAVKFSSVADAYLSLGAMLLVLFTVFWWNVLLCLLTVESDSVWGSVFCDIVITTLVSSRLFYLNGSKIFGNRRGVLFSYWIQSKNPLLAGARASDGYRLITSAPMLLCIGILTACVLYLMKRKRADAPKRGGEHAAKYLNH